MALISVLLVVMQYALPCIPGALLAWLGWWLSSRTSDLQLKAFIRSAMVSIAVTPSIHGHAGILSAFLLAIILQGGERLEGILPLMPVWAVAFPALLACYKKRATEDSPRQSTTTD